jgi:hypothetical protein
VVKTNKHLPNDILEVYQIWTRLNQGAVVSPEEAEKSIQVSSSLRKGHVARGLL